MLRVRQAVWSCAVTGFLLSIVSVVAPALSGSAQRDDPFTPEQHQYWSLKKVEAVDPPAVRNRQWPIVGRGATGGGVWRLRNGVVAQHFGGC